MRPNRFSRRASALSILLILGAILEVPSGSHQFVIAILLFAGILEGFSLWHTGRRQTVAHSEELQLIQDAPYGMLFVDKENIIRLCNDSSTWILGLEKSQILGSTVHDLYRILKIALDEFGEPVKNSIWDHVIRNMEIEFINPKSQDSQTLLLHLTRVFDHEMHQHLGYNVYFEDATARTLWERKTLQSEKLLHVAELAATTAHEVRNPLTTVRGFLQLQQKRHPAADGERDLYKIMIDELDRVNLLVTEYMSFAQSPEHSNFAAVDMHDLILDAIIPVRAKSSNLEIDLVCNRLESSYVLGNAEELKQVILHLLKNAIEASHAGQTIEIHGVQCENLYRVEVIDQGEGISDLAFPHMFDTFFTTKPTGSGLGLSLSKKIIDLHAGSLYAFCDEKGTHFIMELPHNPHEN